MTQVRCTSARCAAHGFTLLEMAIVLVIIGLLVGGVLVGRGLIEASNQRSQISQIATIETAMQAFRLKYGALPGDIRNATNFGLGTDVSLHNGNGDGKLDIGCFSTSHSVHRGFSKESYNFFFHLAQAGMIEGLYEGYTFVPYGSWWTHEQIYGRFPGGKILRNTVVIRSQLASTCNNGGLNGFLLGVISTGPGVPQYFERGVLTGNTAREVDQKADDGDFRTGLVRSMTGAVVEVFYNDINSGSCATVPPSAFPNCRFVSGIVWPNKF